MDIATDFFKPIIEDPKGVPNSGLAVDTADADIPADAFEDVLQEYIGENQGQEIQSDRADRVQVMKDFMGDMQKKFGVSPIQLVNSMMKLSAKEAALPPEENVDAIVQKLGLKGEDALEAQQQMAQFLVQLSQIQGKNETGKPVDTNNNAEVMASSIAKENSKEEVSRKAAEASGGSALPKLKATPKSVPAESQILNASPSPIPSALPSEIKTSLDPAKFEKVMAPQSQGLNSKFPTKETSELKDLAQVGKSNPVPTSVQETFQKIKAQLDQLSSPDPLPANQQMEPSRLESFVNRVETSKTGMPPENVNTNYVDSLSGINSGQAVTEVPQMNLPQTQLMNRYASIQADANLDRRMKSLEKLGIKESVKENIKAPSIDTKSALATTPLDALPDAAPAVATVTGVGAAVAGAGSMTSSGVDTSSRVDNIQKLIDQTQFLVKQNGGEAKVQLNPEGLGKIELRVSVERGKVSIRMLADTPEAKELLQSSMSQIKNSVESQSLVMDRFDVDTKNQVAQGNGSSNARDGQDSQNRSSWSQSFQEGSQQGRNGFSQNLGDRGHERAPRIDTENETRSVRPVAVSAEPETVAPVVRGQRGQRINRVA